MSGPLSGTEPAAVSGDGASEEFVAVGGLGSLAACLLVVSLLISFAWRGARNFSSTNPHSKRRRSGDDWRSLLRRGVAPLESDSHPGLGLLGLSRSLPSAVLAPLAHPLLSPEHTVEEAPSSWTETSFDELQEEAPRTHHSREHAHAAGLPPSSQPPPKTNSAVGTKTSVEAKTAVERETAGRVVPQTGIAAHGFSTSASAPSLFTESFTEALPRRLPQPAQRLPPPTGSFAIDSPGQRTIGEGIWHPNLKMSLILEPAPPFRIQEASPDWLSFCGFEAAAVRGKTLRIVQGLESIEVACLIHLKACAARGVGTPKPITLTNFTKHRLAFTNKIRVIPMHSGAERLLRGFEVRTLFADTGASPIGSWSIRSQPLPRRADARSPTPSRMMTRRLVAGGDSKGEQGTPSELADEDVPSCTLGFKRSKQLGAVVAQLDQLLPNPCVKKGIGLRSVEPFGAG